MRSPSAFASDGFHAGRRTSPQSLSCPALHVLPFRAPRVAQVRRALPSLEGGQGVKRLVCGESGMRGRSARVSRSDAIFARAPACSPDPLAALPSARPQPSDQGPTRDILASSHDGPQITTLADLLQFSVFPMVVRCAADRIVEPAAPLGWPKRLPLPSARPPAHPCVCPCFRALRSCITRRLRPHCSTPQLFRR